MEIVQHVGHFTNGVQETKILIQLVHKQVPVREPVLKDALVFLVKAYFGPILSYSSEVGHCEVNFCNVHIELHQVSIEIQATLKQKIIELVRLSTTKSVRDAGFSSPCISIQTRSLIRIKCVSKSAKYFSQLFISIITPMEFGL